MNYASLANPMDYIMQAKQKKYKEPVGDMYGKISGPKYFAKPIPLYDEPKKRSEAAYNLTQYLPSAKDTFR